MGSSLHFAMEDGLLAADFVGFCKPHTPTVFADLKSLYDRADFLELGFNVFRL